MEWKFIRFDQETRHPFLNFYTIHYDVTTQQGDNKPYSYFLCSRHEGEQLRALTHDYRRPDGVLIALYEINPETKEVSVVLTRQFRPAIGAYVTSFPAGLLDPNDKDDFEAAKREAEEEAGFIIDDLERLSPSAPTSTGLSDEMCSFVMARIVGRTKRHLEDFEDISSKLVSLDELKKMLNDEKHLFPLNIRLACLILLARFDK